MCDTELCLECKPGNATICLQCRFFNASGLCVDACPRGTWVSSGSPGVCLPCHFACSGDECHGPEQSDCQSSANKNLVFFIVLGCGLVLLITWLAIPVIKAYRKSKMDQNVDFGQTLSIKKKAKTAAINAHQFSDYNPDEDEDMMRNNRRNLEFTPDASGLVLRADNIGGGGGGGGGAAAAAAEALSTVSSMTGNGSVQTRGPKTINAAVLAAAATAAEAAAAAPGAIAGKTSTNRRDVEAWAAQSAAATAAAVAGKEKEDPKAPRLSYVGSVASVSPSESISMKHVASKLSIDTTYGDLGSLYDTAVESLGDFHHVRASPETRRKQVAREAQLVKKMKQKDKRGSIASAVSQDDPESFSRRNSEKRKSQRKRPDKVVDLNRVSSISSVDSARFGASDIAFDGRCSVVSTTSAASGGVGLGSNRSSRDLSESDSDYFADPNQRTVRSFNKLEEIGVVTKTKDNGNRLPTIHNIEFNPPLNQPTETPAHSQYQQQHAASGSDSQRDGTAAGKLAFSTHFQHKSTPPPPPPPHAASILPILPTSGPLSEFVAPQLSGGETDDQNGNKQTGKKAPILWV